MMQQEREINKLMNSILYNHLPTSKRNGEMTFAGMLRYAFYSDGQFKGLSDKWNFDTQKKYLNDYKRILGVLPEGKALSTYEASDLIDASNELTIRYNLVKERKAHYEYLLWIVYKAGVERNMYSDAIAWNDLDDYEERDTEKKIALRSIKKSLSITDNARMLDWCTSLKPDKAKGEEIGIMLMHCTGLRNNEVCGLDFESVSLIGQEIPVVIVYQSTEVDGTKLKSGGKTSNAMRIVPLFDYVYHFLLDRKREIKKQIPDISDEELNKFPIVCKNLDFANRCGASNMTDAGRKRFREMGLSVDLTKAVWQEIREQTADDMGIVERDPTTYLFRRNFATYLYVLGFSYAEIQYLIGHDVEDPTLTRNYFVNDDIIRDFAQRMLKHPFNIRLSRDGEKIHNITDSCVLRDDSEYKLRLSDNGDMYKIAIIAEEPYDEIDIDVCGYDYTIEQSPNNMGIDYKPVINLSHIINKKYLR